jgi:hypothetical protein
MGAIELLIKRASELALRDSLADLGCANAELVRVACEVEGVYYVPRLKRLVRVAVSVLPAWPDPADVQEVRRICQLAAQHAAEAWQATVLLERYLVPKAVAWARLDRKA